MYVQALESGWSSDVHGLFTVTDTTSSSSNNDSYNNNGDSNDNNSNNNIKKTNSKIEYNKLRSVIHKQIYHYKASENGIQCYLSNNK